MNIGKLEGSEKMVNLKDVLDIIDEQIKDFANFQSCGARNGFEQEINDVKDAIRREQFDLKMLRDKLVEKWADE